MFRLIETNLVCGFTAVGVDFWNYRIGKPEPFVFEKKNWEDHKKNQNPNRAVCFKTSIKLSSGLHLNISLFQVSRISKFFIAINFKYSHSPMIEAF